MENIKDQKNTLDLEKTSEMVLTLIKDMSEHLAEEETIIPKALKDNFTQEEEQGVV